MINQYIRVYKTVENQHLVKQSINLMIYKVPGESLNYGPHGTK